MNNLIYLFVTAVAYIVVAGLIGRQVEYIGKDGNPAKGNWFGILVDDRLRYSLTHLQVVLWSLLLLSLYSAVFLARAFQGLPPADWLTITVPQDILILAGISGGSAVVATAAKSTRSAAIRANNLQSHNPTHFQQVFFKEDGEATDKVIDVTKFQGFFFTMIAVLAYAGAAWFALAATPVPGDLPNFSQGLLWLIGISQAAYIGGKLPPQS